MFSGFELYSRLVPQLRLVSQPASHRNISIEVTRLQQLAARTDFDNLLQLRSVVMFVLAFSDFFRSMSPS